MTSDPVRWHPFAFGISLLIGCLVIGATFLSAPEEHMVRYFSSDTLYLPSLYRDLFVDDGRLLEWSLNPAPNFFPDMGLFFLLNALFGSFLLAAYVFPMVQFAFIACLFLAILRGCGRTHPHLEASIGVLSLSLLPMTTLVGGDFDLAANFLLNSYHLGAFVNSLLATFLFIRLVRGAAMWWSVPLALVIMAGTVSDRLFLVTFLLPAVGCLMLLMFGTGLKRPFPLLLALMVGASWAADRSLSMLAEATELNIEQPYAFLAFNKILRSWERLVAALSGFLSGPALSRIVVVTVFTMMGLSILSGIRAALNWIRSARVQQDPEEVSVLSARTMVMLFFPMVFLAPVLNGSFDGVDSIRYNYSVFPLALLLTGPLLVSLTRRLALMAWAILAVAILTCSLRITLTEARDLDEVFHYMPERVKVMDRLALRYGLKCGVADYWDAKTMTMFSCTGLKVLPVYDELWLYLHVNRIQMFYRAHPRRDDPIEFTFVVLHNEEQRVQVPGILGQECSPADEGSVRILLTSPFRYDPETRGPIHYGRSSWPRIRFTPPFPARFPPPPAGLPSLL